MKDIGRNHSDGAKIALLTKRELAVLVQVARGMNNKETGDALNIAEQTVKNYLSSIYRKLEVFDRTQAVLFAVRAGIVQL